MKHRLGKHQLRLLRTLAGRVALVVPDKLSRRLCDLGLLESDADGSMARITADGLRALADAADAGRIALFTRTWPPKTTDGGGASDA